MTDQIILTADVQALSEKVDAQLKEMGYSW
jgi:hypothetical protein